MVKITIGWGSKFKSSETDIIKSFIIDDLDSIRVFDELMYGKSSVIWFNNSIRYFWRWEYRESSDNLRRIFFLNFTNEECTHTGSGSSTK